MSTTARPQSDATRAWWAYERAATYDVVGTTVAVPLRDGVAIACELRRPAHGGAPLDEPLPALVLEFTPYAILRDFYLGEADYFTARGYVTMVPLLRGVGGSGGTWDHGSFVQCGQDAHDLVEWLAAQPFTDGRVGMLGESFGGQTSYSAAVERPPHLVAVAPMQSPSSLYDDVVFPGGIKSTERGEIDNWPDIANLTSLGAIDADAEFAANRAHPTFDAFWRDRALVDRLGAVDVPVLAIGGWDDQYFRSGTIANIEALPSRTWAIYGPWGHFFPVTLGDAALPVGDGDAQARAVAVAPPLPAGVLLAWVDHWVAGLPDVPVPPEPTFTSFEGPPGVGAGWREVDGWDPDGATGAAWQLGADGSLTVDGAATAVVGFCQGAEVGSDTAPDAVTFTSSPLPRDEVLLGHPSLAVRATLDAPDANLYAELVDVAPDGEARLVNDGFLLASHRASHSDPVPVPVGEPTELRLPIRPQHHRFAAGHRVRLRLSGGAPTRLVPPGSPVTVTIETGPGSELRLPGFSGRG